MELITAFITNKLHKNLVVEGTTDAPLFSAKDVGEIIHLNNITKDFNITERVIQKPTTMEGNQDDVSNHTFLTEKGLYKALMKSNHPIAEKFQEWACDTFRALRIAGVDTTTSLQTDKYLYLDFIKYKYELLSNHRTLDIFEHLPTLYKYTKECNSVLECGVRECVSSWAFAYGLVSNPTDVRPRYIMNDIGNCSGSVDELVKCLKNFDIDVITLWKNNLHIDFEKDIGVNEVDLTFIDTWHVYGQLRRELEKFAPHTRKYIIMHDTFVDGKNGETIRERMNAQQQSIDSGIPLDEINKGLIPAIEEFVAQHPEWIIYERYDNCNGLTVLKRCE